MGRLTPRQRPLHRRAFVTVAWLLGAAIVVQAWERKGGEEVVGGQLVTVMPAAYRPVVWVQIGTSYCTGTLVTSEWVLTAAHCARLYQPGDTFRVVFDSLSVDAGVVTERAVSQSQIYPGYDDQTNQYDAALLKLAAPVFDITPVRRSTVTLAVGQSATVVGYGISSFAPYEHGSLHDGRVRITSLSALTIEAVPDPAMTCSGDSGGPIFVTDAQGALIQVGLTSWGDQNCVAYGGFTRLSAVSNWMDAVTAEAPPPPPPPPNGQPPHAVTDKVTIPEFGSVVVPIATLLANDSDPENGPLTFVQMGDGSIVVSCDLISCKIDLSINPSEDESWEYVNDDWYKAASISRPKLPYIIQDAQGNRAVGQVELTITPVASAPLIRQFNGSQVGGSLIVTLSAGAWDMDVFTYESGAGFTFATVPVTVSPGDGSPAIQLNPDFTGIGYANYIYAGPGRFTLTATASVGDRTSTATRNIQVTMIDVVTATEGVPVTVQPGTNDALPASATFQGLQMASDAGAGFFPACGGLTCTVTWPIGSAAAIGTYDAGYSYTTDGITASGVVHYVIQQGAPAVSLTPLSIFEGSTTRTVLMSAKLSRPVATTVVITYSTIDGTAKEPGDYARLSKSNVSLPAGTTNFSLPLRVVGDLVQELDETFTVHIDSVSGAVAATQNATVTLKNDDDTTPPLIAAKSDVVVEAKLVLGATVAVSYTPPQAKDAFDGTLFYATCSPKSGSALSLGTTAVGCTASDRAGNIAKSSFNVIVRLPTTSGAVSLPGSLTPIAEVTAEQQVRVTAGGFDPGTTVELAFVTVKDEQFPLGSASVDAGGRFDVVVTLPDEHKKGAVSITARGLSGGVEFLRGWALTLVK